MDVWKKMTPKTRRISVLVGAFAVFAIGISLVPENEKASSRLNNERPAVGSMITDKQNDDARAERLQAQLNNMRDENNGLLNEIDRLRRDMERLEAGEVGPTLKKQLDELGDKIKLLERNQGVSLDPNKESKIVIGEKTEGNTTNGGEQSQTAEPVVPEQNSGLPKVIDEPYISTEAPKGDIPDSIWTAPAANNNAATDSRTSRDRRSSQNDEQPTFRVIASEKPAVVEEEADTEEEKDEGVYLPAGSIVTGTLITGMDAPTGQGARQEPFPALLRVKHEAILPNRFRADIRECFIILGGYGDLSSERAYLRGETISCVRDDGKVVESGFDSFSVGEDGKAGVRGRLVSKQGQILAKAMTAGVLQGFAEAFGSNRVPTLSVEGSETPLYQQAFSSGALQSGAASGASTALDRLAQFYIDQADGMFPVIEVDAGREIELVMVNGGMLAIK